MMTLRRSHSVVMPVGFAIVAMAGISPLTAQPFKNLYLPDTLGGCADFDEFILNPVMNQVYVWSDRSNTLGVLDAATAERHRPFWNIPPHAGYLSWTGFALNPNHNRLYAATGYGGNAPTDTFALVYDCSTRAIVDTLSIPGQTGSTPQLLSMNIPSNQVFWSAYSPSGDSYFSYVFDASTNELRTTVRKEWSAHHETRPRAFSCPRYAYILEEPLLFLDVALDSIDDSILPPPGHSFHQPLLVASGAERLFALACRLAEIRADRLYVIDCLNNQVLGEVQLPGEVTALAYNSANSKLYAACGKTYVIDAATVELTDSLDVSGHLFYNSNTNHLYVSVWGPDRGLCIYDGATNRLVTELQVPGYAGILVPSTNKLFLRDGGFNVVLIDCDRLALERCFKVAFVNQNLMWQPVTNRLYVNDVCRDSFSSILTVYDAHTLRPLKVLDFRGRVEPEEWFYDLATATRENKVYLTSGRSRGIYVLDGATDSLLGLISCTAGGHQLVYSPTANRLFACSFSDFSDGYVWVIDCASDQIVGRAAVGGPGDGYLNPFNGLVYFTTGAPWSLFIVDSGGTVVNVRDSVANPLAFRNKGDIHQVYVGARYDTCLLVLNPVADSVIDTVPEVNVSDGGFAYYDSTDDRLYYPVWTPSHPDTFGILVIDCATNRVIDTIFCCVRTDGRDATFPEVGFWNPVSNRLYYGKQIIDCRTNRVIGRVPTLAATRTAWNSTDNIVFVNDHWRGKVVAVEDDLIGIRDDTPHCSGRVETTLLRPSVTSRFLIRRGLDHELSIFDAAGRLVGRVGRHESVLDARGLTPGVYFATVRTQGRTGPAQKFTVVR